MENVIQVKNLTVRLSNQTIIDNITFTVKNREVVVIIGPNGSGKTMLIRTLLGLVPYTGTIKVLGGESKKVLTRIGYVPQRFEFDKTFPITVSEFLQLVLKRERDSRIEEVLKETDMAGYEKHMLGKLSGGQIQRILIARAIIHRPDILFLDEPTSGIDIEGVKDFYTLIDHMNKIHKVTILMISHEINMVYKFADKILCLNKNLICHGDPRTTLTKEVMEKLYGEPVDFRPHVH